MSEKKGVAFPEEEDVAPAPSVSSEFIITNPPDEDQGNGDGVFEDRSLPHLSRQKWDYKLAYLCTVIGFTVGYGNLWRFPQLIRENGGLAFLVPYFYMMGFVGIPQFFLELAIGQRRRKGIICCWMGTSPYFGGLGICCGWINFMIGLYYNTLISYCMLYLVDSFSSPLPWTNCKTLSNDMEQQNECKDLLHGKSTKYYWHKNILNVSSGIDSVGSYNWRLAGFLALTWGIIWLILLRGTKSISKVAYFVSLFPYVVLILFFSQGFITPDVSKAWLGAYRLVKPDWSYLLNSVTWLKAGGQVFFSLSLGSCLVTFSSYLHAKNDCRTDAIFIGSVNSVTSIFASLIVFPTMGAIGYKNWEECKKNMKQVFPNLDLWKFYSEKTYDIYFSTEATSWESVSTTTPITVRYGYGQLGSNKNNFQYEQDDGHTEYIADASSIPGAFRNISISQVLRDCSIGEASFAGGGGPGLIFIGFTRAALNFKYSNLWCVIYFLMLIALGIGSAFGMVQGAVCALQDMTKFSQGISASIMCLILALLSLSLFPFGWGVYLIQLLNDWVPNWTFLCLALFECIAVAWSYGLAKMSYDVHLMTGRKPGLFILICWKYVTPLTIILLLIGDVAEIIKKVIMNHGFKYTTFQAKYEKSGGDFMKYYPWYSITTAFLLVIFCLLWLPLQALLCKTKYSLVQNDTPDDFPEEELLALRDIDADHVEDLFTGREKKVMGSNSITKLQEYRDGVKRANSELLKRHTPSY